MDRKAIKAMTSYRANLHISNFFPIFVTFPFFFHTLFMNLIKNSIMCSQFQFFCNHYLPSKKKSHNIKIMKSIKNLEHKFDEKAHKKQCSLKI